MAMALALALAQVLYGIIMQLILDRKGASMRLDDGERVVALEISPMNLEAVMPDRVLQYLFAWTDHLFHQGPFFVNLECWYGPQVLSLGYCRGLINIHLHQIS